MIHTYILVPNTSSQFCNEFAVPKEKLEYFKNVTPQDIVCSQVYPNLIHLVSYANDK